MQSLTHTNITNRLTIIARGEKALDDENNDEEMITWKKIIKKVTGGSTARYTLVQEELWSFQTQPYFQISFTKNVLKKQKIIEKFPLL